MKAVKIVVAVLASVTALLVIAAPYIAGTALRLFLAVSFALDGIGHAAAAWRADAQPARRLSTGAALADLGLMNQRIKGVSIASINLPFIFRFIIHFVFPLKSKIRLICHRNLVSKLCRSAPPRPGSSYSARSTHFLLEPFTAYRLSLHQCHTHIR